MARIFFKNMGASLLTTLLILVVSGFFGMIVIVIGQEIIGAHLSVKAIMITEGVLAVIFSIIWLVVGAALNWEWMYGGEDDECEHPPFCILAFLLLFLTPLVFGGTSTALTVTGYSKLVEAAAKNDNYNFLVLLFPPITVAQVCHFIAIIIHYGNWQMCWHCGRMFSFSYHGSGSKSWDTISYKTYSKKENVGSISAGDRKIADISANVTHGYTERTHYHSQNYKGYCICCGREKGQSKLWSETK